MASHHLGSHGRLQLLERTCEDWPCFEEEPSKSHTLARQVEESDPVVKPSTGKNSGEKREHRRQLGWVHGSDGLRRALARAHAHRRKKAHGGGSDGGGGEGGGDDG
tara:strand:+ start:459 stop:776 length:318 start_codon:yes stop_codon:yes gene_type:complete